MRLNILAQQNLIHISTRVREKLHTGIHENIHFGCCVLNITINWLRFIINVGWCLIKASRFAFCCHLKRDELLQAIRIAGLLLLLLFCHVCISILWNKRIHNINHRIGYDFLPILVLIVTESTLMITPRFASFIFTS